MRGIQVAGPSPGPACRSLRSKLPGPGGVEAPGGRASPPARGSCWARQPGLRVPACQPGWHRAQAAAIGPGAGAKPAQDPPKARFHGRHQLNRWADGLEKCVGCELCAWACPADAIFVEGADNSDEERFSPGERYGRVYQINYLRCIFCGLCIEACPTRALTMTNDYELADSSRAALIYEKVDLLGPMLPGMLPAPHAMVPGTTDTDYYAGKIKGSVPEQAAPAEAEATS